MKSVVGINKSSMLKFYCCLLGVQTDSIPCGYNHFICDGECMPSTYLCDGLQHCTNGEDESECGKCYAC